MKHTYYIAGGAPHLINPYQNRAQISESLKLLKQKQIMNQSNCQKQEIHISHASQSQQNIQIQKNQKSRRQNSQNFEIKNEKSKQLTNQNYVTINQNKNKIFGYQSPKTHKNIYNQQQQNRTDRTSFKTEPDYLFSDRIPALSSPKQNQTNLKQSINKGIKTEQTNHQKENSIKFRQKKSCVDEKILDLLMLSTRELKLQLAEKHFKQTSVPKTTKSKFPPDFFAFKKQ